MLLKDALTMDKNGHSLMEQKANSLVFSFFKAHAIDNGGFFLIHTCLDIKNA